MTKKSKAKPKRVQRREPGYLLHLPPEEMAAAKRAAAADSRSLANWLRVLVRKALEDSAT